MFLTGNIWPSWSCVPTREHRGPRGRGVHPGQWQGRCAEAVVTYCERSEPSVRNRFTRARGGGIPVWSVGSVDGLAVTQPTKSRCPVARSAIAQNRLRSESLRDTRDAGSGGEAAARRVDPGSWVRWSVIRFPSQGLRNVIRNPAPSSGTRSVIRFRARRPTSSGTSGLGHTPTGDLETPHPRANGGPRRGGGWRAGSGIGCARLGGGRWSGVGVVGLAGGSGGGGPLGSGVVGRMTLGLGSGSGPRLVPLAGARLPPPAGGGQVVQVSLPSYGLGVRPPAVGARARGQQGQGCHWWQGWA
jgi:hypothetical protein